MGLRRHLLCDCRKLAGTGCGGNTQYVILVMAEYASLSACSSGVEGHFPKVEVEGSNPSWRTVGRENANSISNKIVSSGISNPDLLMCLRRRSNE